MKFYNTLRRRKEEFVPLEDRVVKMYACGPTVHDRFTIGNARAFIVFDAIRRYLEFKGYKVIYTQNITDIEDKIINRAQELGVPAAEVAQEYTAAFLEDIERLGVLPPTHQPRATEMVPQIIEFIQDLIGKGYAYTVDGDVYYRVRRFKGYGKLSGKKIEELEAGARVEPDERKEDPLDFALWKRAKEGEPSTQRTGTPIEREQAPDFVLRGQASTQRAGTSWESPWGPGRPGWHIECSVMAIATLGETIDIHGGGADLIFPHHENEIAQSEAKTGKPFARFWLHNGLLMAGEEEMHKSLGNFEYAKDVVERHGREAVRLFFLSKHYRKPVSFSHEALEEARAAVERVYNLLEEIEFELEETEERRKKEEGREGRRAELDEAKPPASPLGGKLTDRGRGFSNYLSNVRAEFEEEMDDDFNTAGGIGVIFELVRRTNTFKRELADQDKPLLRRAAELIRELGEPLGLFQEEPQAQAVAGLQEELIELLLEVRQELRTKREFELADRIRDRLNKLGIELRDRGEGTRWSLKR